MTTREKSERATSGGVERRAYPAKLEIRSVTGGKALVEGYASVTETPYEMWDWYGEYTEVVRKGAFAKTLAESPQVQLLLNHTGLSMAYTKGGSLRLSEDSTGLHIAADVNGSRRDVHDMIAAIEDGDIDEMSFAFRTVRQQWSPDYDQRDLLELNLNRGDVSVVNFGASPATSVGMRAQDFDQLSDQDALALYERLGRRLSPPTPQRSLALMRIQALNQG